MTNKSYIIVGFCQSILMNLSFHKNNWGPGPQLTMGATPMVATHLVLDGPYAFLAIHQIQFLNDLIKAKEQGA